VHWNWWCRSLCMVASRNVFNNCMSVISSMWLLKDSILRKGLNSASFEIWLLLQNSVGYHIQIPDSELKSSCVARHFRTPMKLGQNMFLRLERSLVCNSQSTTERWISITIYFLKWRILCFMPFYKTVLTFCVVFANRG
jgi:hypothetical protein